MTSRPFSLRMRWPGVTSCWATLLPDNQCPLLWQQRTITSKLKTRYEMKRVENACIATVSYTHLDVYKRQVVLVFVGKIAPQRVIGVEPADGFEGERLQAPGAEGGMVVGGAFGVDLEAVA